jgi:hypothetical protein
LIGLIGRKYKGYDGVLLKERNILKRVFFNVTLSYQELKEVACGPDIGINRGFLQFDIASHVKEKAWLKRVPPGIFLHHVSIKKAKMISYCIKGISQCFTVS